MSIDKPPAGTRGASKPPTSNPLAQLLGRAMQWLHRRQGDRFMGMDVLYLTTVGARTGQRRTTAVARLADGEAWLIVASNNGAAVHPGWYHNLAAHPDQVWIELDGQTTRVEPEQLDGDERADAWRRIVASYPRFAGYQAKTDRHLPVLRLTPVR